MADRQKHPAQDTNEVKVHARMRAFDILVNKGLDPDDAAKKAKEIADSFTSDYDN
jgi:hypothetical protein